MITSKDSLDVFCPSGGLQKCASCRDIVKHHKRQDNGLLAASEDEETTLGEVVQQGKNGQISACILQDHLIY